MPIQTYPIHYEVSDFHREMAHRQRLELEALEAKWTAILQRERMTNEDGWRYTNSERAYKRPAKDPDIAWVPGKGLVKASEFYKKASEEASCQTELGGS